MSLLRHPRLPEGEATHVLASGEFPWLAEALERRGVTVVATQRDSRLPGPVQFHPDLQTCPLPDKQMFVLKNSPLQPGFKSPWDFPCGKPNVNHQVHIQGTRCVGAFRGGRGWWAIPRP